MRFYVKNLCQNICKLWEVYRKIVEKGIMWAVGGWRMEKKNEMEFHVFAVVKN
jgi:hypothetical protein